MASTTSSPSISVALTSFILLLQLTNVCSVCTEGFVERTKWVSNNMFGTICCKFVSCQPGTYVVKCTNDGEDDTCQPCPPGTNLLDSTSSANLHDCVPYSCPSGSVITHTYSKTGCHRPCACDTNNGFYGHDPCNCKVFKGSCHGGFHLNQNGTCERDKDSYGETIPKPSLATKKVSTFSVPKERDKDKVYRSTTTTIPKTTEPTHLEAVPSSQTMLYGITALIIVVIVFALVFLWCKCCKRKAKENGEQRTQNEIEEKSSIISSQDSGISVDLNNDTELKEILVTDECKPLTKVGVVKPTQHDKHGPEAATLIPCSQEEEKQVVTLLPSGSRREFSV